MTVHRSIFWTHLVAGVVVGVAILGMSVTGLLLAFDRQIIALAEQSYQSTAPTGTARLGPEALLAKVKEALPEVRPQILTLRANPAQPATVNVGGSRVLFVNPYTGEVMGEGSWMRGFLHDVEQFHRNLMLGQRGKAITGAFTLAFLALVLTGVYLWWPRQWIKKNVLAVVTFRPGLKGRAKDWNWHNVIGFWSSPLLITVILTGLIMSYPWANDLLFRVTGNEPPPRQQGNAGGKGAPGGEKAKAETDGRRKDGGVHGNDSGKRDGGQSRGGEFRTAGMDPLWERAAQESPSWYSMSLRLANAADGSLKFVVEGSENARPDRRTFLTLNRQTGEVTNRETYDSYNLGRKLRLWIAPVHTGAAGGFFGNLLAAIAALSAILLVWTGIAMSWQRFFRPQKGEPGSGAGTAADQGAAEEEIVLPIS